jgi:hypothetical protein
MTIRSLILTLLAVLATGCVAPAPDGQLPFSVVTGGQSPFYANHLVVSAARNGLGVVVLNSPFGQGSESDVVAALEAPTWTQAMQFVPARPDSATGLRMILAFSLPAADTKPSRICQETSGRAADRIGISVIGVFCNGREMLSFARASAPRAPSPDHPGFRRAMASLSANLFPFVDPAVQGR